MFQEKEKSIQKEAGKGHIKKNDGTSLEEG